MRIELGHGRFLDVPDPPEPSQCCREWKERCRSAAQPEDLRHLSAEVHHIGSRLMVVLTAVIRGETVTYAGNAETSAEEFGASLLETFRRRQAEARRDASAERARLLARIGQLEALIAA